MPARLETEVTSDMEGCPGILGVARPARTSVAVTAIFVSAAVIVLSPHLPMGQTHV